MYQEVSPLKGRSQCEHIWKGGRRRGKRPEMKSHDTGYLRNPDKLILNNISGAVTCIRGEADCLAMSGKTQQAGVIVTCCCGMQGGDPWLVGAPQHQEMAGRPLGSGSFWACVLPACSLTERCRVTAASVKLRTCGHCSAVCSENSKC